MKDWKLTTPGNYGASPEIPETGNVDGRELGRASVEDRDYLPPLMLLEALVLNIPMLISMNGLCRPS